MSAVEPTPDNKNKKLVLNLSFMVIFMLGLAYASVPLYQLFCQVTGFGGTPKISDVAADEVLEREITVRFGSAVSGDLPWRFRPNQLTQTAHIGESVLVSYQATNTSDQPIAGTATYNVSPAKAAAYFVKLDCFCFTEQVLQPGQSMTMPVLYYIDPAITEDRRLDEIKTITLSYTFFEIKSTQSAALIHAANPTKRP
ncbi:MAG: cytochrome c oxidase assembly protein [Robiginitomaculum sp.]|nr:cytochrome c oxidase assembly protein [Robiginitomaculum sp.]